jgi:hypothetical protein
MDEDGALRDPNCVVCGLLPYGACDWHILCGVESSADEASLDAAAHPPAAAQPGCDSSFDGHL